MPRPKRIQIPGLIRHVMARGNGRMRIFRDDVDYRRFVQILGTAVEEHQIECWTYCAMPNHYHAVLRPTRDNLSEGLARINGDYAQWWNRRHRHVGHAFQGPFKDQIVQQEGYLLTLLRYVARNPVRPTLVTRAEDWRWSSYPAIIGLTPAPSFLAVDRVLALFGHADRAILQQRFAAFVDGPRDDDEICDRIRAGQRILGDKRFRKAIRERGSGPDGTSKSKF